MFELLYVSRFIARKMTVIKEAFPLIKESVQHNIFPTISFLVLRYEALICFPALVEFCVQLQSVSFQCRPEPECIPEKKEHTVHFTRNRNQRYVLEMCTKKKVCGADQS